MDLTKELLKPKEKFHNSDAEYDVQYFSKALESRTLNDWPIAEWPFGEPYESLVAFKYMVDVVIKMSWHEHTQDWNPELVIEMKDGTEIQSVHYEIRIPGWKEISVFGLDRPYNFVEIDVFDEEKKGCIRTERVFVDQIKTVTFMPA